MNSSDSFHENKLKRALWNKKQGAKDLHQNKRSILKSKYQQLKQNIVHKGFSYDQVEYIPRMQYGLTHINQTHNHVIHIYKLIYVTKKQNRNVLASQ